MTEESREFYALEKLWSVVDPAEQSAAQDDRATV